MAEAVKVTHVFLSTGIMLHVVGSKEMIGHALRNATSGMFLEVTVPIADKDGKAIMGPILINRHQVVMVTDDHDFTLPSSVPDSGEGGPESYDEVELAS